MLGMWKKVTGHDIKKCRFKCLKDEHLIEVFKSNLVKPQYKNGIAKFWNEKRNFRALK